MDSHTRPRRFTDLRTLGSFAHILKSGADVLATRCPGPQSKRILSSARDVLVRSLGAARRPPVRRVEFPDENWKFLRRQLVFSLVGINAGLEKLGLGCEGIVGVMGQTTARQEDEEGGDAITALLRVAWSTRERNDARAEAVRGLVQVLQAEGSIPPSDAVCSLRLKKVKEAFVENMRALQLGDRDAADRSLLMTEHGRALALFSAPASTTSAEEQTSSAEVVWERAGAAPGWSGRGQWQRSHRIPPEELWETAANTRIFGWRGELFDPDYEGSLSGGESAVEVGSPKDVQEQGDKDKLRGGA